MPGFKWLTRRKKTEPELPYQPPIWLGDWSNGELYQRATPKERLMHELILQEGDKLARRYGMERREFMASSLGMALSMSVINLVNGCSSKSDGGFHPGAGGTAAAGSGGHAPSGPRSDAGLLADGSMHPAITDPSHCETALDYSDMFIFDIQTHRVERANAIYRSFLMYLPQGNCGKELEACYSKDEYTRQFFLESDTTVSVLSGIPATDGNNPLTNEEIAETRDFINGLATQTQRVVTHAMVLPNYNHDQQLEGMLQIAQSSAPVGAWKCYTPWGPGDGVTGFWLDDPAIGLPFIEQGRKIGIKTFCCHKGLPLPGFDNNYGDPKDIGVVAKMYPDCKFVVYHSAYQFGDGDETKPYTEGSVAGVNSLITACRKNGIGLGSNVYGELGTTWRSVMTDPVAATHVLGKLLKYLGEDNVVWGTDCMWYGSPQPLIQMFMSFTMDQNIRMTEGYPDLTAAVKRKILGLNAAKAYGIDAEAVRCGIKDSAVARYKRELDGEFGRYRWAFQKPVLRTRRDFLKHTAFHRAAKLPG